MNTTDFLETVRERGFVKQTADEEGLVRALARPLTLYCGYDPTADSLTAGHLLSMILLRHAQQAGHRPICVVGGATGMIGDPTGKSASRPSLTVEGVRQNLEGQRTQLSRILDFSEGQALILNNADWLARFNLIEFLRDVGLHFTVAPMLSAETYETRLASGLTFTEFSYMLLQAYDFLHLYRELGCVLQVGGSDQWANILAGADLIRRVERGSAYALVTPLLTTASGAKMGKSAAGAIWLDPARTSPYDFYQYWVNTEDGDVARFLALFTFLPMDEVRRLGALEGAELREAKRVLAFEVTSLVHGAEAAEAARHTAQALFGGLSAAGTVPGSAPFAGGASLSVSGVVTSVPTYTLGAEDLALNPTVIDLLVRSTLCASRSEARRLIEQGGVTMAEERVAADMPVPAEVIAQGEVLLRAGKKRYYRIVFAPA